MAVSLEKRETELNPGPLGPEPTLRATRLPQQRNYFVVDGLDTVSMS